MKEISKFEIILLREGSSPVLLHLKFNQRTNIDNVYSCSIGIIKKKIIDKKIEDQIITSIWEIVKENLVEFSMIEEQAIESDLRESEVDILKKILKFSCERPYLDFKTKLEIDNSTKKAECIKDIDP